MNIYFLIDRSGSMASRWEETISAVNTYANEMKDSKSKMSVLVFDGSGLRKDGNKVTEILRDRESVLQWKPISSKEVFPRGMTPLFDAIGELGTLIDKDEPQRATVVILTDGEENASHRFSKGSAGELISLWKTRGYDVIFLGADFNAFGEAHKVGVAFGSTLNMSAGSYNQTFQNLAMRGMAYASSGATMDFTDEDRAVASGKKK